MKQRFDRLALALTLLFSAAGCLLCVLAEEGLAGDAWGKILWTGMFFALPFVGSLLGSFLAEALQSRRFTVLRRRGRILTLVLAAVTGLLAGGGGQALYMLSPLETQKAVDMVLLLDGSGSMEEKKENCDEAAEALLAQMDENSRAQVVSFAAAVLGNTELLPMDDAGKETLTDFIRDIDVIGGTEFGQPLSFARNTLEEHREEGRTQAVVLLSDGEGALPDSLETDYKDAGLVLYTIRIDSGTEETEETKKLIRMAEGTGGFDTLIPVDADGRAETGDLTEAFSQVFEATRDFGLGSQMIVYGGIPSLFVLRFLIRTLVFGLYAVMVGAIYYRRMSAGQLLGNLASGAALAVLVTLCGQLGLENPIPSCVLFCLLVFAAYTTYDYDEEVEGYV